MCIYMLKLVIYMLNTKYNFQHINNASFLVSKVKTLHPNKRSMYGK